jgi:hypothetical protein
MRKPVDLMSELWTKTSLPSAVRTKPKPRAGTKDLTVPVSVPDEEERVQDEGRKNTRTLEKLSMLSSEQNKEKERRAEIVRISLYANLCEKQKTYLHDRMSIVRENKAAVTKRRGQKTRTNNM